MKQSEQMVERENIFDNLARMEERISRIKHNLNKIKQKSYDFRLKALQVDK
jgi:regulator of replication initiation timing